ncbi:MAG: zinc-ribbon domain-containing protein [Pseudomonadota bacterium]
MRLICPNCDAEYEVDADLFPPEGREVQCSNCSNTWFVQVQGGAFVSPDDAEPEAEPVGGLESGDDEARARQEADPKALGILHAEVEREKQARAAEAGGLETQADLGLDDAQSAATPAERSPEPTVAQDDSVLAPAPRRPDANKRELLPDIEEINSTLAEAPDPDLDEDQKAEVLAEKGKSSFRIGFGLALLLTAAALVLYAYSPELAERFPQAAEALQAYVNFVDGLRVSLAMATDKLVDKIDALTEQVGSS